MLLKAKEDFKAAGGVLPEPVKQASAVDYKGSCVGRTASQPTCNIIATSDLWRSLTQDKKKKKAEAPAVASAEVNFPRVRLLGMLPRVVSSDDRLRRPTLLSCLAD